MGKAYFISDLHLGATYSKDNLNIEKKVVKFLDSIKEDAAEIYLLGDILDYWFEYKYVVPKGYVRFFGKLAELADSGIKITWIIGNHDIWIFDYIPSELGVEVIDGILERKIMGIPFCIQHGDAVGGTPSFRILRALFRNKVCQKLYSGLHPRWTVGFAYSCSRNSRQRKGIKMELTGKWPKELIFDIREWCRQQIRDGNPAQYFLLGHLHALHDESLPDNRRLIVLPAFPDKGSYGIFDGSRFEIKDFFTMECYVK